MSSEALDLADSAARRADRLKERVYITFTALAVVLTLRTHDVSAVEGFLTLLLAVVGTMLAVLLADVVAHLAVHEVLPTRAELRHMLWVSFGSFAALVVPFILLGLAVAEVWELDRALRVSAVVLVASLVAIGWVAVRRSRLPTAQRFLVLFAEFVFGALVVVFELLIHG